MFIYYSDSCYQNIGSSIESENIFESFHDLK